MFCFTSSLFPAEYNPDYESYKWIYVYDAINYAQSSEDLLFVEFVRILRYFNVEYEYLGTHWDGDPVITNLITDYAFGNDYLTRPLVPIGATYGLIASRNNLTVAKGILTNNKNKIDQSEIDRKSTRLNSSHVALSRMPSSA